MFVNVDFFKSNKENDEQMFINVKKFSTFDFLLEINSEKLSERAYDSDSDVFITVSTFN